jgi:hypothetical protein
MNNGNKDNGSMFFQVEEINADENITEFDLNQFINENDIDYCNDAILHDELMLPQMINYHENYTIKQLLQICDYYGFAKDMKSNKFTKEQIVDYLVGFETDIENSDIVFKRQNMWFYMNELASDKFMKKFILWK